MLYRLGLDEEFSERFVVCVEFRLPSHDSARYRLPVDRRLPCDLRDLWVLPTCDEPAGGSIPFGGET